MDRLRIVLLVVALIGWAATAISHLRAAVASDDARRTDRLDRRNQFLLLSSLSTNALVFTTLYRWLRRRRR